MTNYSANLKKITNKRLAKSEAKPFSIDDEADVPEDRAVAMSIHLKPKKKFSEIKEKVDKFAASGGEVEEEELDEEVESPEEAMEKLGSSIDEAKACLEDGDTEGAIELLDKMQEYYNICSE